LVPGLYIDGGPAASPGRDRACEMPRHRALPLGRPARPAALRSIGSSTTEGATDDGDSGGRLGRERRLIDRDDWTPPAERIRQAEAEREQEKQARRIAEQMPTIAEYGAKYCERDDLAPTTRDRYRMLLRLYINGEPASMTRRGSTRGKPMAKAGIGDVRVTELTRAHVRQWWQGLPVKVHEGSSRQAYDLLRAIMNTALDDELVEVNPVRIKDAARAQVGRERDLDPLPVDVLFAVADAMPERYRLRSCPNEHSSSPPSRTAAIAATARPQPGHQVLTKIPEHVRAEVESDPDLDRTSASGSRRTATGGEQEPRCSTMRDARLSGRRPAGGHRLVPPAAAPGPGPRQGRHHRHGHRLAASDRSPLQAAPSRGLVLAFRHEHR